MSNLLDRWSAVMMNNYGTPPLALAGGQARGWWLAPAVVALLVPLDLYILWRIIPLLNP